MLAHLAEILTTLPRYGTMRRSSYAAALTGNPGSSPANPTPTRSGAFSHLISSASTPHTIGPHRHSHSRSIDADAHNNGMSTSWGRGGALPSYSSQTGHWQPPGAPALDIPPLFVPSYLRDSKHAEKLQEAHRAKLAAQLDYRPTQSSNPGSLSTSSSSINLHKMAGSHRGLAHEVIERAPVFVDEPVSPWPTRWNENDKFAQLDVEDGGRQARFSGSQKTHDEAASVRAECAMPRQCGIYYYEVTVVSKGKDGYGSLLISPHACTNSSCSRMIGVGFSGPKVALNRIPGWEPDSFAYHGDDGQIFNNTTSGKNYGPKSGTLDVIGCGINFRTNTAFFTKNGHMLGMDSHGILSSTHHTANHVRHCFSGPKA